MKRKLDQDNVPSPVDVEAPQETKQTFQALGLDSRLLTAISTENFASPTLVQEKAIPLALEGKDLLVRAKTGSGKTAAYVLPILEAILRTKPSSKEQRTTALILVPTRELAEQIYKAVIRFTAFCSKEIRTINLTQKISDAVQRSLLADCPDIVVATPARAALSFSGSALNLEHLKYMVIDEADLVLSYGYNEDLQVVAKALPQGVQTSLMSATMTTEVETLKGLFCTNPAILKLEESSEDPGGVTQYVVRCAEDEKFLLIYVILKLKLIKGKCIIFVSDIDRCYRLKLFLEQFGSKSCVLNSELPVNSRIHIVEEFNKNIYDIIIATDEHEVLGSEGRQVKPRRQRPQEDEEQRTEGPGEDNKETDGDNLSSKRKQPSARKDKEYGISRGIDFHNVACVLNFDLPTTSKSYTHRIGRTARAGKTGMALSFVVPISMFKKHKPTSIPSAQFDEQVLAKITTAQQKRGKEIQPYVFDSKQTDAFRYRMNDALRAVTSIAVREARTKELRSELIKSEKLKRHFEENPDDLANLRHDGESRAARVQPHLKHVPDYLMPNRVAGGAKEGVMGVGFVGLQKEESGKLRGRKPRNGSGSGRGRSGRGGGRGGRSGVGRRADPLKTFKAGGRK